VLVLRRGGELGWVFGYSLEGESWDGEEDGEIEEESIGRVGIYWRLSMESPTERFRRYTRRWVCHVTVWRSWFESLGHFVGKIVLKKPRHHTVTTFQKNYIICRRYGRYLSTNVFCRYIPSVSPMKIICLYIPTEVEMKLFSSVIFTDEKIPLVIPLVFADFLVVDINFNWTFYWQY
jgi:hypothetical protein